MGIQFKLRNLACSAKLPFGKVAPHLFRNKNNNKKKNNTGFNKYFSYWKNKKKRLYKLFMRKFYY